MTTAAVTTVALVVPSSGLAAGTWSGPTVIDKSNPPENISCPATTFCAAVGVGGYGETFNGSAWGAPANIDPSSNPSGHTLTAISCPSASFCAAVDQAGNALTFNGRSWTSPVAIEHGGAPTAVSCTSASFCVAGDNGGAGFIYNGSTWSAAITINNVSNHESIGGISCPSASFCVAVGERGDVETSTNGGSSWTTPLDIATDNLMSVSCPSASFCVAIDAGGNAYTYNGASWSAADPIDIANGQLDGGEFRAVSCPSSAFCVAIDAHETVLTFNGSSWSAPEQLEPAALASGVSCASSSFCVAVDGGGNAFVYGSARAPTSTLPAPVLGKTANVTPVSGVVFVRPPLGKSVDGGAAAGQGFVRLTAATQIPIGSEINSLHGSLKLVTAAAKKGQVQGGTFRGAVFRLTQAAGGASKGLATLSLVESAFKGAPTYASCQGKGKAGDVAAAAASGKVLQLLRASAHGRFRTRGRYSAATVLGTIWTVADRCDGTLTHDVTDRVSVTDFVRHKTVVLHAGQSYLAKAPART
ncbi:MAG TPA: hypothetical protein VMJ65_11490 [Solirubrobacteraceae bacterium]|nr:hypothetical protein [Solirubrobacteraceae bacterium]